MIIKNEIPILEYDDSSVEVIAPDHDLQELKLPVQHGLLTDSSEKQKIWFSIALKKDAQRLKWNVLHWQLAVEKGVHLGLDVLRDWK